jgi:hypothetical protein
MRGHRMMPLGLCKIAGSLGVFVALQACSVSPVVQAKIPLNSSAENSEGSALRQAVAMRACQAMVQRRDTTSTIETWNFGPVACQNYAGKILSQSGPPARWELLLEAGDCPSQRIFNPLEERREGVNDQGALQTILISLLEGQLAFRIPESCKGPLKLTTNTGAERRLELP